jgi:uncharacterized protein YegP (UPF0339 family)
MKFLVFQRRTVRGKRWFFHLKAQNGEIICQGESYHNVQDALKAIERVMSTDKDTAVHVSAALPKWRKP